MRSKQVYVRLFCFSQDFFIKQIHQELENLQLMQITKNGNQTNDHFNGHYTSN